MPSLYATPHEIKAGAADAIRLTTTKYDAELMRLAEDISRGVDNYCHRQFYPALATRYFHGAGGRAQRFGELLAITSVSVSDDDGATYTELASTDYFGTVEHDPNSPKSWTHLELAANGEYSAWKIVGVWGYADDREAAWEDSADDVEDNPLSPAATTCTVNDADGLDGWGRAPRFQAGQLARLESEYVEITAVDTGAQTLTLVRARGGTSAASHAQNTGIDLWRPPAPVKEAVIIQIARLISRARAMFGDAQAVPELSQLVWTRSFDPDVVARLAYYVAEPVHG
jgi:hypothetical protein